MKFLSKHCHLKQQQGALLSHLVGKKTEYYQPKLKLGAKHRTRIIPNFLPPYSRQKPRYFHKHVIMKKESTCFLKNFYNNLFQNICQHDEF